MSEFRTIIIKNSSTPGAIPTVADLEVGELALNIADRLIYTKNETNEIVRLGSSQEELDALALALEEAFQAAIDEINSAG